MTTEIIERDGEVIEQRAPMTLFGTDNPAAIIDRASTIASALGDIIRKRQLFKHIGNHDHVYVEGWTLLGSMLGVFAEVAWSRPVEDGWEARAVARTLDGRIVGAAEAMCTRREGKWRTSDDYAMRSMAQTRAVSKALRLPLGFIIELAGYSATPADEVNDQPERSRGPARAAPNPSGPAPVRTPEESALIGQLLEIPGMTVARMTLLADAVGIPKGTQASADQLRAMLARATEQPESSRALRDSGVGAASVARGGDGGSDLPAAETPSEGVGTPSAATEPAGGVVPPASPAAPAPNDLMDDIIAVTGGEEIPLLSPTPGSDASSLPPKPGADASPLPPKKGTPEYTALPNGTERAKARAYWESHPEPEPLSLAEQLRVEA